MIVAAQAAVVMPVTPYRAVRLPTVLTRVTQSLWPTNRKQNLLNTNGNAYRESDFCEHVNDLQSSMKTGNF
jgi:hypothetical protein